ncbi:hypothetical protein [Streptomyces sp. IB201691-2A2]|uniref:hypothetical protein n=1 Tax=Streptomyces sp. IB201691-2A2 TaxID=2561920 RepID=UPI00117C14AC|nr:hypothetical protein [Streptomyces sp. IB201691-2A2]TRO62255.1 hypothetical protein E4K73_23925 [Streptomyces sp. IB201691-2A2]
MLRHAIAPVRRYTKASHDVVRHSRLNSDAKVLLLYVQGLPESEAAAPKPLSEHAARLGLKGRAYQKAKQLLANVTLTRDEASRAREGGPGADVDDYVPSERPPTVGGPGERTVGDSPQTEDLGVKDLPHPPPQDRRAPDADETPVVEEPEPESEAEPGTAPAPAPELAEAEGVLLSLRHTHRDLLLGVREARLLADAAAEWLRRGVSAPDLRRALTTGLPADGIRSAVGFLRHRLIQKLPAARRQVTPTPPPEQAAPPARRGLVTCPGPGTEHVFRPRNDETHCLRCRTAAAFEATLQLQPLSEQWRTRVQECAAPA